MTGRLTGRHLHLSGPGYAARAVARVALAEGAQVSATLRDPARARTLSAVGIEVVAAGPLPEGVTDLLISAPPGPGGCPVHAALAARLPDLCWIGYFSSTAVYGDCGGMWIDEDRTPAPMGADARARLLAEGQWAGSAARSGAAFDILRIAGIYGPEGRNVLGQLRAGSARAILKPGQVFNRIHRDDIAGAALAAMITPQGRRVTNLADGHPCAASEVLLGVAAILGLPPPPEVALAEADLPPGAAAFYAENRRLRNDRLLALPGFSLCHSDWRSGYAAIIAAGG